MSDRDTVFASIRSALAARNAPPSPHPDWDTAAILSRAAQACSDLESLFVEKLQASAARLVRGWDELAALLRAENASGLGFADPTLDAQHLLGTDFEIETTWDRSRVDAYAFGITRASLGIAESGSLMLKDADTASRLGALAPWVHIAVLRRRDLVRSLSDALAQLGEEPYTVWVTGPSKTGDVEGILIQGVHGPGIQVCCLVD